MGLLFGVIKFIIIIHYYWDLLWVKDFLFRPN